MRDRILELIEGRDSKTFTRLVRARPEIAQYVDSLAKQWGTENINETVFCIVNECEPTQCPCGAKALFNSYSHGYRKFCSYRCPKKGEAHSSTMTNIWEEDGDRKQRVTKAVQETMMARYGASNAMHVPEIVDRVKQTNLLRYGVELPFQSAEIRERAATSLMESHGVRTPFESEAIRQQAAATFEQNHGAPNRMQIARAAYHEKHGVENTFQVPQVKEKIRETLVERYGVDHPLQSPEIRAKHAETFLKKYGVKNAAQLHINRDLYEILNDKNKFLKMITESSVTQICNLYQCTSDLIFDYHERHDLNVLPKRTRSRYEEEIADLLTSLNIEFVRNTTCLTHPLQLDFYIPDYNLAIEFNGLYWHSESSGNKNKHYHAKKTQMCDEKNVQLLTIFEDEWLSHNNSIISHIKHLCNRTSKTIGARCMIIKEITDRNTVTSFLNSHHIQGSTMNYSIALAAYHNDKLCAVFTISKQSEIYDITRYCTDLNASYAGLFSKFISYARKQYNINHFTTMADLRWSCGKIYTRSGFTLVHKLEPDYFYTDYHGRYHKFNYRKSKIASRYNIDITGKTERELTILLGLDRIWDCGKLKYQLIFK